MKIKRGDIIAVGAALLLAAVLFAVFFFTAKDSAATVRITLGGSLYGEYPLSDDRVITIEKGFEKNTVVIKNGAVSVSDADCPGRDCVYSGAISHAGEVIVCLPHALVVTVVGGEGGNDFVISSRTGGGGIIEKI